MKPFVGEILIMQEVGVNSFLARIIFLQNFCTFRCFQKALNEAKPRKCMNTYIYLDLPNKPYGLKNRTFCSLEHFAPWEQFASKCHGTLCIPTHFPSEHTLLWKILLLSTPGTLYSLKYFATWKTTPQNTLYPGTLRY